MPLVVYQPAAEFQSTRPRGARPGTYTYDLRVKGFNPRARGGRDEKKADGHSRFAVSIHAPAGGATSRAGVFTSSMTGFNPRARGGRDLDRAPSVIVRIWFQSTRPRGARPFGSSDLLGLAGVSIHAPAGGATCIRSTYLLWEKGFNPRARGGRDPLSSALAILSQDVSIHAPAGGATLSG